MKLFINLMLLMLVIVSILPFVTLGPEGSPLFKLTDLKVPEFQLPPFLNANVFSEPFSDSTKSSETEMIYKWYDADGQIHYTSAPPPADTQAEILRLESNSDLKSETEQSSIATMRTPRKTDLPNAAKNLGDLYSPEGIQQIMERTRNVQRLLNERQKEYDRLLDKE